MNDELRRSVEQARAALDRIDPDRPGEAIPALREARERLADAFNEALGLAALEGRSVRRLADEAGLAPNSIPPRLGASRALAPYAVDGRVTSEGLARARFDAKPPLRFTPRRTSSARQEAPGQPGAASSAPSASPSPASTPPGANDPKEPS